METHRYQSYFPLELQWGVRRSGKSTSLRVIREESHQAATEHLLLVHGFEEMCEMSYHGGYR